MSASRRCAVLAYAGFALLVVVLALGTAWPAGAVAGEWLFGPYSAGLPSAEALHAALAMNATGEAALIFPTDAVSVSLRPEGGTFEDPAYGGVPVSGEGVEGFTPAVAIDARGDVVAVWQQDMGPHHQIYEATRSAGGSFGAPLAVSPEGEEASDPTVAIDAHGKATVAWLNNDGASEVVETATAFLEGAFSSPAGLSGDGGNASNLQVTADPGGDVIVSWERESAGGPQLEVAIRRASTDFPAPDAQGDGEILGEVASGAAPHVVIDGAGEAITVWGAPGGAIRSARLTAGASSFDSPVRLANTGGLPSVAMNEVGETVAVWPSGLGVQVATAAPEEAFNAPVEIPLTYTPSAAQVAIGTSGGTAVEWEGASKGLWGRGSSSRPGGGTFSKPTDGGGSETPVEGSLVVASDSAGDMLGVWSSTRFDELHGMLYDTGPQLGGISAPAGGVVGQLLSFSIPSPLSVWRPLNSITWNLGDGTTASGLSVSHAYAEPGTYKITVTATDMQHSFPGLILELPELFPEYVGNSESQTVTVSSAPVAQGSQTRKVGVASESLSDLRVKPHSFVAAATGPSVTAAGHRGMPRTGTTVRFMLALSGRVTFSVDQPIAGVRRGGRCARRLDSANAHVRKCMLLRTLGRFVRSGSGGSNSFHFTGRVNTWKLKPGNYLLLASAVGTRQAARSVAFRVLSR